MFRPETEDMLPRCAPKPSVPLNMNTATIVRPTVPEVSILFGAQQAVPTSTSTTPAATSEPTQPTYAAWKKQVLPKVSFPPVGAEVYSINGHIVNSTNVCSAPATTPYLVSQPITGNNTQIASKVYAQRPIATNATNAMSIGNTTDVACRTNGAPQPQQYRRSLDHPLGTQENKQVNLKSRSLDVTTVKGHTQNQQTFSSKLEVLTICAGTQTESTFLSDSNNIDATMFTQLATKEDLQQLHSIFGELRADQLRLMNAVEALLNQQMLHTNQVSRQDASTQYSDNGSHNKEKNTRQQDGLIEEYNSLNTIAAPSERYQQITKVNAYVLESPRQPAAQSTAYQPNTPRNIKSTTDNIINNKPSTEQSMLMNELALKYLPNEKLNELLHELNISPTPPKQTGPLRPIENTTNEKRPSDISNASYKYLQKYRLLPDVQNEVKEKLTPVSSPLAQASQQQLQHQSPYQQRLASPCVLSPQAPMLDLEHIRRQPKLI